MNKFIHLIIALTITSISLAQSVEKVRYINPEQVQGVYNLGQYAAVLAREGYRAMDDKELFTIHYLDEDVATQQMSISRDYRLFDVKSFKDQGLLIFNGPNDILLVRLVPNSAPEYFNIATPAGYRHNRVDFAAISDTGEMVLVRNFGQLGLNDKGEEVVVASGLEYINLDSSGAVTHVRYQEHSDTEAFELMDCFPTSSGMVYHVEHIGRKTRDYKSKLVICDQAGNKTGEFSLIVGEETFFPSDVINDNGKLVMAGFYMDGTVFTAKRTEGLFMAIMAEDGAEVSRTSYNWDNLKSRLKETRRSEFIFNGRINVLIEKIESNGAGYTILGESYGSSNGVTDAEFFIGGNNRSELVITVLDFVMFSTDYNGSLTAVEILEKEECNILMEGYSNKTRAVRLARALKDKDVFPYKDFDKDVISFINYKATVGAYSTMDVNSAEISTGAPVEVEVIVEEVVDIDAEEAVSNSKLLTKLDNMDKKIDKMESKLDKAADKLTYEIEKIDQYFNPRKSADNGLLFLTNGKVLSYQLHQDSYGVYYKYLN